MRATQAGRERGPAAPARVPAATASRSVVAPGSVVPGSVAHVLALQRAVGNQVVEAIRPSFLGDPIRKERELSDRYGITVGPAADDGPHFSMTVLTKIEKVLRSLPQHHVRSNGTTGLRSIVPGNGSSDRSWFEYNNGVLTLTRPEAAVSDWLWTLLTRAIPWMRGKMDEAVLDDLGIDEDDREDREVMGGEGRNYAGGNLASWTIRHEIGHSVDQRYSWQQTLMGEERFGGWDDDVDENVLADGIVTPAGLPSPEREAVLDEVAAAVAPVTTGSEDHQDPDDATDTHADRQAVFTRAQEARIAANPGLEDQIRAVMESTLAVLRHPWTLPVDRNGANSFGGRTYHLDEHGELVSYLTAQRRRYAVSYYQFSSPAEWFAEAYAAFFGPDKRAARRRLNPAAVTWFEEIKTP